MSRLSLLALAAAMLAAVLAHAGQVLAQAPAGEPVDESALRYYASLRQTARVEAETRRLQRLHPGWAVPADLYTVTPGGIDEAPLWELFAADRFDDLHAAIAARRAADPAWRISDDLARKLQRKELRAKVMNGAKAGHWLAVANLIGADGEAAIDEKDVEALWLIANAFAVTNQAARAVAIYRSILTTSNDAEQRVATIHKAMSALRMVDAEKLIAMARPKEGGGTEFDVIGIDITRARISAFLHDEWAAEVSGADLRAFQDFATASEDPNQAGLVAWWYYKRKEMRDALEWFKLSLGRGGDAMIAYGLAHTLRKLGMMREAEEVSYAWRDPLVNNAILFIDLLETDLTKEIPPYIEPERIARYAQVTLATASGEGAQALAWYAYNSCQYDAALEWFQRGVAWFPKEATVYGYGLTLRRLKRQKEYLEIVNRYDGLFPKVVELVFPDDRETPPTPCEQKAAPRKPETRMTAEERAALALQQDPRAYAWGRVPKPGSPGQIADMPVLKKNEFPIAVTAENPLRFAAGRAGAPEPAVAAAGSARERAAGTPPLVARRVPGVGPMPYERFGYALLAGWNGTDQPSSPPANARPPASGTLWAQELGLGRAGVGRTAPGPARFAEPGGPPSVLNAVPSAGPASVSSAPAALPRGASAGSLQP